MTARFDSGRREHAVAATTDDALWTLLLGLARLRRDGQAVPAELGMWCSPGAGLERGAPEDPRAQVVRRRGGEWAPGPALTPAQRDLLELYLPVCPAGASRPVVVGHLGQSVDGQIATASGDSCYVTGRENLVHLHRMRALCDAVVVGAGTVETDDPRLTTRLVQGPNPVRVIIDPQRRLGEDRRVLADGEAPTLIACESAPGRDDEAPDRYLHLPRNRSGLSLPALVSALGERGLHAVFVEGGGVTVSRWIDAGLLDRLQVAIAPVLVGQGRRGLQLPPAASMQSCLRPPCRVYRMGEDLLWDFDLRSPREASGSDEAPRDPLRVL